VLAKCEVDVREITLSAPILASRVRISSWIPSAKYAFSLSLLRFSNGSTAIDLLEMALADAVAVLFPAE
jgi:hypothetical protein